MLIALRFNLSVDYNIELPQNKAKTTTTATSKAEASSSFKGFGFFKTLCKEFVVVMQGEFEMSMMGDLSFFLGL